MLRSCSPGNDMDADRQTLPDVTFLVPHADSMVLIDRVVSATDDCLCAEVHVKKDSLFCNGNGIGAWVGVEYMAQAIAAHAGYMARLRDEPVRIGFLLGTRNYECWCDSFLLGSVLSIKVKRLMVADNGIGSYDCEIGETNKKLAQATLTVFQPEDVAAYIEDTTK